jgi:hypothetical protein
MAAIVANPERRHLRSRFALSGQCRTGSSLAAVVGWAGVRPATLVHKRAASRRRPMNSAPWPLVNERMIFSHDMPTIGASLVRRIRRVSMCLHLARLVT